VDKSSKPEQPSEQPFDQDEWDAIEQARVVTEFGALRVP
jgi:hypothetical protein